MAAAEIAGIKKLKIYNTVNTKMRKPNLTINIISGVVDSVDGLPEGWTYQVIEHGND